MEWGPCGRLGPPGLEEPHEARRSVASLWTSTATPNCRKDGKHAGDTPCTAGGAVARDEIVVAGKRENTGRLPPGWPTVGQGHHRHGCKSGGCYRMGPERGEESGHRECRPGGRDTPRPYPDRRTSEVGGALTAIAWKAAQVGPNAKTKTKTKPNPKAEPIPSTETTADTAAENHIGAERVEVSSANTDQTMGDGLTTKPKEPGQPSPSHNYRLQDGRQTPNSEERRECATPQ